MNILGVIPARGGSKEVPRKNLLKIGGKSLIELAYNSALESTMLTRVILSSDDKEIINEGLKVGCPAPFKRPSELATDKSSTYSVLKHGIEWLSRNENWDTDIVVLLQPTTPFRKGHHIDSVIKLLINSTADASMTIRKPDYPPHWMMVLDKKDNIKNMIDGGNKYKRRQDTPLVYQPAGMVYAFRTKFLFKLDRLLPCGKTKGYIVSNDVSINIDTQQDYEQAKIIWKNKNCTEH